MGDLSWLKGTQSNTLCSGFFTKALSWGLWQFFPHWYLCRNRYFFLSCVEFENVMKSNTKKKKSMETIDVIYECSRGKNDLIWLYLQCSRKETRNRIMTIAKMSKVIWKNQVGSRKRTLLILDVGTLKVLHLMMIYSWIIKYHIFNINRSEGFSLGTF